jgi:hypothetical protein
MDIWQQAVVAILVLGGCFAASRWLWSRQSVGSPPSEFGDVPVELLPLAAMGRRIASVGGRDLLVAWRGDTLLVLSASRRAPQRKWIQSRAPPEVAAAMARGAISRCTVRSLSASGRVSRSMDASALLPKGRIGFDVAKGWLQANTTVPAVAPPPGESFESTYFEFLDGVASTPDLVDFAFPAYAVARRRVEADAWIDAPPFDRPEDLPALHYPTPQKRSALFLHNNYYSFNMLAAGLRRRGWDALTVSLLAPDHPNRMFLHGEDLTLFDPDPAKKNRMVRSFLREASERFSVVHFYGQGTPSLFDVNFDGFEQPRRIPWDMMELRRHRMVVGYTPSGCLDGSSQTSIRAVSGNVCSRCVWELRPDVCSDPLNLSWARKLEAISDWVGLEGDWGTPERSGPRFVRNPIVTAMDRHLWSPDIVPPEDMRLERAPGEILVYHAVGNYEARRHGGRDIKGTGAVMGAIERLQAEGVPVRLVFATQTPSVRVKYLQVQADIVIDQLNYGRIGANSRECLMLGKPIISRMVADQAPPLPPLAQIEDSPILDASEATVYAVLRDLVARPQDWLALGAASRAFALKWHDSDVCAERFEKVIDRVRAGLPAETPEMFI